MNITKNWVEYMFGILLVCGLLMAYFISSAFLSFVIVLICGMIAGRIFRSQRRFPVFVIISGFILGYIMGSQFHKGLTLVFFVLGVVGYNFLNKSFLEE